ncbi:MAG: hypothetical protein GQ574_14285 [Crocinitomix sp.]|nr:hypothetical protein [Crocinitomix sp.]
MHKVLPLVLYALILLTFSSCKDTDNRLISKDPMVLAFFTVEEAKELQLIHDFFIDQICPTGDENNANGASCLTQFMQDNKIAATTTGAIDIPIEHTQKVEFLKQLSPALFNKIWTEHYEFGYLEHDNEKTYMHFLYELGYYNDLIKEYSEECMSRGGVNGFASSLILNQPDEFDMTDCKQRLLIAIHYFTWDYNNHISEKVYGEI